jgi:hypothetical protein
MERALAHAEEARATLATGGGSPPVEFQSTESFFRGGVLPEAGRSTAVQTRAFELPPGELSKPLPAENGYVLVRVIEASGFSDADFASQRPGFHEQIENEHRGRVWNAFVQNLTSRYDVRVDWQAIRSLMG